MLQYATPYNNMILCYGISTNGTNMTLYLMDPNESPVHNGPQPYLAATFPLGLNGTNGLSKYYLSATGLNYNLYTVHY